MKTLFVVPVLLAYTTVKESQFELFTIDGDCKNSCSTINEES